MNDSLAKDAERFQTLQDFVAKKEMTQTLELRAQSGDLLLDDEERLRCATSPLDFLRIATYLVEEHEGGVPDYRTRRIRVQHETERLRAAGYDGSLMPLSYALGSFLAMLQSQPRLREHLTADSAFRELREDLARRPEMDRGGQISRNLDAILEPSTTKQDPEETAAGNRNRQSFWKTIPGILTGIAAVITAATGLYLAIGGTSKGPGPPPGGPMGSAILEIRGVELLPASPGSSVQVVADVNGTEFRYPSLAGIEWAEVGPGMSSQQFTLPAEVDEYRIRFRMKLKNGEREKELVSQETKLIGTVPFSGAYNLHERAGRTRTASVGATINFSVRRAR